MFTPVCQVVAPIGRQSTLFGRVRQGGGTGDEVCRLRLHLVGTFILPDEIQIRAGPRVGMLKGDWRQSSLITMYL